MKKEETNEMTAAAGKVVKAVATVDKVEGFPLSQVMVKAGNSPVLTAMTEQQEADYTASCVIKLNEHSKNEALIWIEAGKLVSEFVARLYSAKGLSNESCFQQLADHPTSKIKAQQIRYYFNTYRLFHELGKEAPNLPITHYISVLPKSVAFGQKKALLKEAAAKDLSVSQLKNRVREAAEAKKSLNSGNGQDQAVNWDTFLNKVNYQSNTLLMTLVAIQNSNKENIPVPSKVKKSITASLKRINDFVMTHNLLAEKGDCDAPTRSRPQFKIDKATNHIRKAA